MAANIANEDVYDIVIANTKVKKFNHLMKTIANIKLTDNGQKKNQIC